ncbi:MAG: hypothetical protein OJF49_001438 [Ktedonobacterales bacterium]|nr:MAG: hypothetical protein OJF49_001438 [Ktedonobacterales bacterium]
MLPSGNAEFKPLSISIFRGTLCSISHPPVGRTFDGEYR